MHKTFLSVSNDLATRLCLCAYVMCVFFNLPISQICGFPLRGVSSSKLGAVLRSGRSVDAERLPGGHAGHRGNGPSEARADRLLRAAGGQRPAGSQCGSGPVDGHGSVATAA